MDRLGVEGKFKEEVERLNQLRMSVLGEAPDKNIQSKKIDVRAYAKYLLKNGSISDKRDLLMLLRSKLTYTEKKIYLTVIP